MPLLYDKRLHHQNTKHKFANGGISTFQLSNNNYMVSECDSFRLLLIYHFVFKHTSSLSESLGGESVSRGACSLLPDDSSSTSLPVCI